MQPSIEILDTDRFPRLSRYVQGLPRGIDSHPEHLAKASTLRKGLDDHPPPADLAGVPAPVAEAIRNPPPPSAWIPVAVANGAYLTVADHYGWTEDDYQRITREVNAAMFRSPLYRVLMMLVSPEQMLRGAQRRWSAFFRGPELEVDAEPKSMRLRVTYPAGLFDRFICIGMVGSMHATIEAAGGQHVRGGLDRWSSTEAEYTCRWS